MTIQPHIKTVLCSLVLCISVFGLLTISGCIKPDAETLARIDELETRLNHFEELLEQAQSQREALVEKLESVSTSLIATQAQMQEVPPAADQTAVDAKLSEILAQRDAAMAEAKEVRTEIQQLYSQLAQQAESTDTLQTKIAALQEAIIPPADESVSSTDTEEAPSKGPVVGFPEGDDPSVIVIRGRSQN